MSTLTISDLRAKSKIDPQPGGCWHWQGARSKIDGLPRIWTLDYERMEKRVISGPKAIWNIAHGAKPNGIVYRRCGCADCVNPVHIGIARDMKEIGAHISRSGRRKGTNMEQRRAAAAKGRAAQGQRVIPDAVVIAIRNAPASVTSAELAALHKIDHSHTCRIRRGTARAMVAA